MTVSNPIDFLFWVYLEWVRYFIWISIIYEEFVPSINQAKKLTDILATVSNLLNDRKMKCCWKIISTLLLAWQFLYPHSEWFFGHFSSLVLTHLLTSIVKQFLTTWIHHTWWLLRLFTSTCIQAARRNVKVVFDRIQTCYIQIQRPALYPWTTVPHSLFSLCLLWRQNVGNLFKHYIGLMCWFSFKWFCPSVWSVFINWF